MRIAFVCTGGTCRSPMLRFMFADYARARGAEIEIVAAGLDGRSAPMNPLADKILCQNGVAHEAGISVFCSRETVDGCDYVFAMEKEHLDALVKLYGDSPKFVALSRFNGGKDVFDPYGLGQEAYETVAESFQKMIPLVYAFVFGPQTEKVCD